MEEVNRVLLFLSIMLVVITPLYTLVNDGKNEKLRYNVNVTLTSSGILMLLWELLFILEKTLR